MPLREGRREGEGKGGGREGGGREGEREKGSTIVDGLRKVILMCTYMYIVHVTVCTLHVHLTFKLPDIW